MKRENTKWTTKTIAMIGVLIALSIVTSRFLVINPTPSLRLSVSASFTMLAGIWFGPLAGALAGGIADLLGCVIGGQAPYLPLTLSPVLAGLAAGFLSPAFRRTKRILNYGALIGAISFFTSFLYSSWCLSRLLGSPFWSIAAPRALQNVLLVILNTLIVYSLYHGPVTRLVSENESQGQCGSGSLVSRP